MSSLDWRHPNSSCGNLWRAAIRLASRLPETLEEEEDDEGEGVEEESVNSHEHQPFLDQLSNHKEPSGRCQIGIQDAAGPRPLFPSSPGPVGPNMGGGRVRR